MAPRLLVTDDALIIRELVKASAIKCGWEIAGEASNGQEAIEQYAKLKPDAVTLDIVMPEFDGFFGLKGILDLDPDATVLMVSAINQQKLLDAAMESGATIFLIKPFKPNEIEEALGSLCPTS